MSKLEYPVLSKYWVYKYLTNLSVCVYIFSSQSLQSSLSLSLRFVSLGASWPFCGQSAHKHESRHSSVAVSLLLSIFLAFSIYFYLSISGFIYSALGSYNRFLFGLLNLCSLLHFCFLFLFSLFCFCVSSPWPLDRWLRFFVSVPQAAINID